MKHVTKKTKSEYCDNKEILVEKVKLLAQMIKASKKVIEACDKYKKSCGTQISETTEKAIKSLFKLGYTYAILGSDLFVLWRWAEEMKKIIGILKVDN